MGVEEWHSLMADAMRRRDSDSLCACGSIASIEWQCGGRYELSAGM